MVDFVLGRLKFVYKGNWTTSTAYIKDDIVTYGGRSYVCLSNHTSSSNASGGFYTDSANWNIISDGIANRGVWATSTYYKVNDIAKYGGRLYIATSGHTSNATSSGGFYSDISNWQLLNDGTENKNTWSISTYYKVNDVVKYGGRTYLSTNGHTSSATANGGFYSDIGSWQLLNDGIENRSSWSTSTYYKVNDLVKYGGRIYIASNGHTSNATSSGGFYSDIGSWQLLNDGTENKGTWSTSTYYKINDVVKYGGKTYLSTNGHTSSATANGGFYSDGGSWQLLNDGVENRTTWSTSTYYKINDVVKYGGRTYLSTNGHTSSASSSGGFYSDIGSWQLLNDGFDNKGSWVSGTYYKINDVVKWGSSLYICNTGHTAGANWVDTEANFTLFVGGLEFEDSWANTTLYQPGDIVRYGGYQFVSTNESTNILPTNTSFWDVLSTGFTVQGTYNNATTYKPGDVVQFGGYVYSAKLDTVGVLPSNTTNWSIVSYGLNWNDAWSNSTVYYKGDTVRYGGSSYISVTHSNANNEPNPGSNTYWNLLSQGANSTINLTNPGDMLFLNVAGIDNLPIGSNGYILTSNTTGFPEWKLNAAANNVYYVSVDGVDSSDAGNTLQRPFRTIKYASQNVPNNSVIMVKAGTYQEILPITVPPGVSVMGDSQRSVTVTPAAGYSGSGNTMWLLSDATLLKQMTFTGMTGFAPGGTDDDITTATVGGVFIRLNPASPIVTKSPYVLECTSKSVGGTGVIVDGSAHGSGFKSMVFHAYTNINDGGIGYWVSNNARAEIVSCFTYFCYFGFAATAGGFIRGLNNNNSYGKYGAVSRGYDASEAVVTAILAGQQLQLTSNSAMTYSVGEIITGGTSGANGVINNVQTAANKVYYSVRSGTFQAGELITGGTSNTTGIIATGGVTGQKGFVVVANNFTTNPTFFTGRSIEFSGDSSAYVVQSVSGTYSNVASKMVFVLAQEKTTPSSNGANVTFRQNYSQIRLTGHDFLDIGTGNTVTTNYPNAPITMPSQTNEVVEGRPGRVYYVSTDQNGNFRVGDYFRIDQATGRATLDASAFDLSGLTELRLGSIGAQLGETINEFSSDGTLGGNSNLAVPTEQAVKTYVDTTVATSGSQTFLLRDISESFDGTTRSFTLVDTNTGANVAIYNAYSLNLLLGGVRVYPSSNTNVIQENLAFWTEFSQKYRWVDGYYLSGTGNNVVNFYRAPKTGTPFYATVVTSEKNTSYSFDAQASTPIKALNVMFSD